MLKHLLRMLREAPISSTGYVYDADRHNGWGNSISWLDYDTRRISGFLRRTPLIGDEIQFKMASGKKARYLVAEVEQCTDPSDMFFATIGDIGYVGEEPTQEKFYLSELHEALSSQKGSKLADDTTAKRSK